MDTHKYPISNFTATLRVLGNAGLTMKTLAFSPDALLSNLYHACIIRARLGQYQFIDFGLRLINGQSVRGPAGPNGEKGAWDFVHKVSFHSADYKVSYEIELFPSYGFKKPNTVPEYSSLVNQLLFYIEEKVEADDHRRRQVPDSELPF